MKSTLDVRPIFDQRDDSVIGHIVGCFLALRLESTCNAGSMPRASRPGLT